MQPTDHNDPYEDTYLLLSPSHRSTSSLDSLRIFLLHNLPVQLTYTASEKRLRKNDYREGKPPQNLSPVMDGLLRFAVSFVGGAFVVIPMLIMSFDQSNVKSLITVSASVTLFGLVVSLGIRVSSIETLVATATYAAVLVVFVGSTSGNGVD
jgi:VIT1/CCC1 family predicted Fe2+/Mn2+ transporter